MKPMTPLWCAVFLATSTYFAACAGVRAPTAAESELLAQAQAMLEGQPHEVANLADQLLKQNPQLREARLLRANSLLAIANSPDCRMREQLLRDASNDFDRALGDAENKPFAEPLRTLAETYYQLGEWEQGSRAARRSANGFAERVGQENQKEYAKSRLIGANCDFRLFVDARQPEIDGGTPDMNGIVPPEPRTMALARIAAAGYGEARIDFPAIATNQTAAIELFLGQNGDAISTYERGLINHPYETAIHDAYIDWMCKIGQEDALVGAYRRFVREKADAPILRWFQARAIYRNADRLRREGNFQGAVAIYQKSRAIFGEYLALMPNHRDASKFWQALCDLSMARCSADTGDLEAAAEYLFASASTSPKAIEYLDGQPALTDSFGNHFTGAAFAIHVALQQAPERPLEKTLAFNEAVFTRFPDRWGFLYNNAALAARDLGVQVQNGGDETAAMELWERSYLYYEKAVELSPTDARIVNDCGLMLIYHLNRDFDRARMMFDRAIEIGSEQLANLPSDVDIRERQLLEEAVGDAWQNIAVMMREHQDAKFPAYQRFCEEAIKFYPYQRREAAALLRKQGASALGSTARAQIAGRNSGSSISSANLRTARQGGAAEALKKSMPEIEKYAAEGNFDAALTTLDKIAKDCKRYAPFHLVCGQMNWRLANQARDNGRKGTEAFYQDAVRAFQRAVDLDPEPNAPRQQLAQAQYDAGETAKASEAISSLLLHMQSQGGGSKEQMTAAHSLRANAASRAYAAAKQANDEGKDLLTAARGSMRWLEQQGSLDANLTKLWAVTEQWAAAPAAAVNVYIRACERAPADFAMLELLVSTAADLQQLPLAVDALAKRGDAGTTWYRGKAQYYLAGTQRAASKIDEAMSTLDEARESFEASMQKNPNFADSCEQWIAMTTGKKGNIAFQAKKYDLAEELLLEAAEMRPDRINEDLGLTETTKRGILFLVDNAMRKNDLKKAEALSRRASDAANSDVDLLNNSGLFARDYGNVIERAGKTEEAKEMYEQSYKAYSRAVQLDGKNVRLRNDCALIAIYHLDRDWDKTKALLDAAIADGDLTLEGSPPDNEDLKQQLEEAVGDCYENLALWHLKHSKDGAAAKAAATKSQDYYPGKRRPGARRHLANAERLLQDGK
jgi:hypothetical protein